MKFEIIFLNKNLGIEILRSLLSFWVVLFHCLNSKSNKFIKRIKFKLYHVPCFTFISFYFTANLYWNKNIPKIKSRLERLLVPFMVFPLIIYITQNCLFLYFHFSRYYGFYWQQ